MTIKRLILIVLTVASLIPVVLSLGGSLNQPQVQARLQLYQTNLVLQAAEFEPQKIESEDQNAINLIKARNALIGSDPYSSAEKQYQEAQEVAQKGRSSLQEQLQKLLAGKEPQPDLELEAKTVPMVENSLPQRQQLQLAIAEVEQFIDELNVKIGILQAVEGNIDTAFSTWKEVIVSSQDPEQPLSQTAMALVGLWSQPPLVLEDAQNAITANLDGWFRDRALTQFYRVKESSEALATLGAKQQALATAAILKLAFIGAIPFLGGVLGVGLLIFLIAQLAIQKERSLLATNSNVAWETPWDWEIIWQVLIVGFFFVSQILLPLIFSIFGLSASGLSLRLKAVYVLGTYLLVATGGLSVLYLSIRDFFPLPKDWFRLQWFGNWIFWGLGGYLVALPTVVIVSIVNQQIWQGQGGSNPLLFLALQAQDQVALLIFFITASVAAPIFEEIIFRGFLLPSLTRYLPVWAAILASSLVFSFAHLSLAEVLPLTALGIVLAVVYTRSRNLLASILLHSLWNSGTLLSLFILGSGA